MLILIFFKHTQVAETEEFLALPLDEVSTLVGEDELFVISEAFVFNAVLSWVKVDRDIRSEHLPFLLAKVRLPLLTPQFLSDTVASDELIRASHKCRDLLDEARDYHLMPERRSLMQSFRTKPRRCRDIIGKTFNLLISYFMLQYYSTRITIRQPLKND